MINRWNDSELKDIFLGDCAMTFPSHVVDDFIPQKNTSHEKYLLEFISTFWRNTSLSLEELVLVMVSK